MRTRRAQWRFAPVVGVPYGSSYLWSAIVNTVTLSSKGQLVIPGKLRRSAGLQPGDRLAVSLVDGEIRLRPLLEPVASSLDEVAGCLAKPWRRRLSEDATQAAIRARLKARNAP